MSKVKNMFDEIHASDDLINSTKQTISNLPEKKSKPIYKYAFGLAVCVMAMIMVMIQPQEKPINPIVQPQVYTYISIDVNPSIELVINENNLVEKAVAYNEDGKTVLATLNLQQLAYLEAVETLINSEEMKPYFEKDNQLVVTVSGENQTKVTDIENTINQSQVVIDKQGEVRNCESSYIEEAHHNNLSVGKYCEYLALKEYDETITPEQCHSMSMQQIRQRIRDCNGEQHHQHQSNGKHHGWNKQTSKE